MAMSMILDAEEKKLYKYFAFISYSSRDEIWGKKLQRHLERYSLPARLRKKYPDAPKRAYPIFRDDTGLAGVKVWESLEKELNGSQYLIVLCSPRSAASKWVNDEIQYFVDQGRENRILPLIIEGIPYSGDPATECFPPALRNMKDDPLGVSVQALGWRNAYLKMVSVLLHIDYDELLLRDKRRRVRNGLARAAAGAALAAAAFGLLWHNTEHSKYYNAYTLHNEIPSGLYELTRKQRNTQSEYYRITTLRGRVVRLETINSCGTVIDYHFDTSLTDYPILEYQYDGDGRLTSVVQMNAEHMEITRKVLTANPATGEIAIDFRSPSNATVSQTLSADMSDHTIGERGQNAKSEISRQHNTYDDSGRLIRTLYQRDNWGTPTCDSNGVYGKAFEYNEQGLVCRIWNLDENGEPFNCRYGWAYEDFTYDAFGNPTLSAYFDKDGNRAWGEEGRSAGKLTYNSDGNVIRWEALDAKDQLICAAGGYAVQEIAYIEDGLVHSGSYFDADGNPVCCIDGFHRLEYTYDGYGRVIRETFYGTGNESIVSPQLGFAMTQTMRDKNGRVTEVRYLDTAGQPVYLAETGACGYRYTYDENGHLLQNTALDHNWEPTTSKYGNAVVYTQRDGDGRILREECQDTAGQLVRNSNNTAVAAAQYDQFGNQVKLSYFDEQEQPCCSASGYSSVAYSYDNGNLISEKYFDVDGTPTTCSAYYHELRMDYDERGNRIRWSYLDAEGNPVILEEGYAILEVRYDRYGNEVEHLYFSAENEPACHRESGAYGIRLSYDEAGRRYRTEYLNEEGNPAVCKFGYAIAEYEHDRLGRILRESYFDEDGSPVRSIQNCAAITFEYDNTGNTTGVRYLDENGGLCYSDDGFAVMKRVYENGRLISEKYFDTNGAPMLKEDYYHEYRLEYDEKGNVVAESYLDTEGNLMDTSFEYAFRTFSYDIYGNQTEVCSYMADGEPAYLLEAYVYEYEYDRQGNIIREVKHTTHPDKLAAVIVEAEYDRLGNPVLIRYFDENGVAITADRGPFCAADEYDHRGNVTRSKISYDNGYAYICVYTYDTFGNRTLESWSYEDPSGQVTCFEQTRMAYDIYGNCIRTDYLDGQGNPVMQEEGYASIAQGYSPVGDTIWWECYDENGAPALYGGQSFRFEFEYDARGNQIETRFYDAQGNPHKESSGLAAMVRYDYDARGIRIYQGRFNEHGKPFGTEEDPYSVTYYTIDSAGFIDKESYYSKDGALLLEKGFYAYAGEVYEGRSGFEAGVQAGQFIIQLGQWNYFDDHPFSASADLRAETSRTIYTEKELVMCEWTGDNTFIFRRYQLPAGEMGIRIRGDIGDVRVLEAMKEAYLLWLRDNPPAA